MNLVAQFRLPGLEDRLRLVEGALRDAVTTEDPFLTEVAGHLVAAGGKRLRPVLVLASAAVCGVDATPDVLQGAVSVELVHLGSLYHDDVMDEAESRRGVPSVNFRYGNLVAILAGDFLLARASELAAGLGTEVAALLARTIGQLCQGEVAQLEAAFNPDRSEEAYERAIAGKTASLLATSSRIGALAAGGSPPAVEALTAFGHAFGMAFQIWDDIRDLVSTDDVLGKPAGHDMVEGTYTLPVIRALVAPGVGDDLRSLLGGPLDGPARDKARDLILGTDAVSLSVSAARRWADRADDALRPLARHADADAVAQLDGLGHRLLDDLDLA
ncbi:polyprenyl synthetase family protein [Acidiferrimicrobium sp. IK]|uniref:polyprenyl synthetase family protein n=1 Tax=Acidiferrimicrobium sp. IK TaxID=2871700 RepID=UPI0021CB6138|nr:polyprenyl synthetase family protein [Acidiferrimicrobium sp. IK]MCU4186974.1 polyprenyl synthetase family protein [Acidiferrimicrobium sp. IK]